MAETPQTSTDRIDLITSVGAALAFTLVSALEVSGGSWFTGGVAGAFAVWAWNTVWNLRRAPTDTWRVRSGFLTIFAITALLVSNAGVMLLPWILLLHASLFQRAHSQEVAARFRRAFEVGWTGLFAVVTLVFALMFPFLASGSDGDTPQDFFIGILLGIMGIVMSVVYYKTMRGLRANTHGARETAAFLFAMTSGSQAFRYVNDLHIFTRLEFLGPLASLGMTAISFWTYYNVFLPDEAKADLRLASPLRVFGRILRPR